MVGMQNRQEIPQRFPPPLGRVKTVNGVNYPVTEDRVFIPECGQLARLRGVLVVCVRPKGHPVAINYGHSNGYVEWCFEAAEPIEQPLSGDNR
jgi:hypothetical protein